MRKQMAIVIDASGSMFAPAGNNCQFDKIVEAVESVKWMLDNIKNLVRTSGSSDQWAISLWYFATNFRGLVGQTLFDSSIQDFTVNVMKNVVQAIVNPASTQADVGSLTDIFRAMRETADWMNANPPTWSSAPTNGLPDKKVIFFFTDGSPTIPYGGGLTQNSYETNQGVDFVNLLRDRNFIVKAQGIGSDLLNSTLQTLVADAAMGSSVKVIASEVPGYTADCAAAIMSNALNAVNNNGILSLRTAGVLGAGLLWEQFSLPRLQQEPIELGNASGNEAIRLNANEFEIDVDDISKELILGLTWHQSGSPTIEAISPSGSIIQPGVAGSFLIPGEGLLSFHIPKPEAGTWRIRVNGDPQFAPMRLNLMARGIEPAFQVGVLVSPFEINQLGATQLIVTPLLDNKAAKGDLTVQATVFGGEPLLLKKQKDGTFAGEIQAVRLGMNPIRVEVTGKLANGQSVQRMEFATLQAGRPKDPRLTVKPRQFSPGQKYSVEIAIKDASFERVTQILFGEDIVVHRFVVLNANQARAEIEVLPQARLGQREVVTFFPDAETLTGIEIMKGDIVAGGIKGRVTSIRFNSTGQMTSIMLDDGQDIRMGIHDERMLKVLEQARDRNQVVEIRLDNRENLSEIRIFKG